MPAPVPGVQPEPQFPATVPGQLKMFELFSAGLLFTKLLEPEVGKDIPTLASNIQSFTVALKIRAPVAPQLPLTTQLLTVHVPIALPIQFVPQELWSIIEFCIVQVKKFPEDVLDAFTYTAPPAGVPVVPVEIFSDILQLSITTVPVASMAIPAPLLEPLELLDIEQPVIV